MSLERVLAFSSGLPGEPGWPHRNLHTDEAKAREAGLPAIIASGTQSEGHLIELMIDLFGHAWHHTGVIELKVPLSVFVGDTVQAKATLISVHQGDGECEFVLDAWCEKQTGEKVLVGQARGRLPD
jgi:acyl dehydratase